MGKLRSTVIMRSGLVSLWVWAVAHVSLATTWNEPWQETKEKK